MAKINRHNDVCKWLLELNPNIENIILNNLSEIDCGGTGDY